MEGLRPFQGLEEVRADKAESLGGCGAVTDDTTLFREIFSPLFLPSFDIHSDTSNF